MKTASPTETPWLTRAEAADYARCRVQTLANLASLGKGPRFVRAGGSGRALYRRDELDAWLTGEAAA